jgi:hypothetical protein
MAAVESSLEAIVLGICLLVQFVEPNNAELIAVLKLSPLEEP